MATIYPSHLAYIYIYIRDRAYVKLKVDTEVNSDRRASVSCLNVFLRTWPENYIQADMDFRKYLNKKVYIPWWAVALSVAKWARTHQVKPHFLRKWKT